MFSCPSSSMPTFKVVPWSLTVTLQTWGLADMQKIFSGAESSGILIWVSAGWIWKVSAECHNFLTPKIMAFWKGTTFSVCFQRQFQTSPQASEVLWTMYFARFWEKTCITIRVLYNRINVLSLDKTRFLPRNQLTGLTGVEKTRSLIQHCKADFKTS